MRTRPLIAGLALVKNEEDVIEPFVRHNLQFVDLLFVGDNCSSDRTRELLQLLQQELPALLVFDDPVRGYEQAAKMLVLYRWLSAQVRPDFIVPLDADEYIDSPSREAFLADLALIPADAVGGLRMINHSVVEGDVESQLIDPPRSIQHVLPVPHSAASQKTVLRLDGQPSRDIILSQGNHFALQQGRIVPGVILPNVTLGHYPKRSPEQWNTKIVLGWLAYLAWRRDAAQSGLAWHWMQEFTKIVNDGPVLSISTATHEAELRPQQFNYVRKYPVAPRPMFSRVVLDYAQVMTSASAPVNVDVLATNLATVWQATHQPTDFLRYTQFLILEAGATCNMNHEACPVRARDPGTRLLDVDKMVQLAVEAYLFHGFYGFVGFHYYNEPMLEFEKIVAAANGIKQHAPAARFILWTNGTIRPEDARMTLFDQVYCSDYTNEADRLWGYYQRFTRNVQIITPQFDQRLHPRDVVVNLHPCGRPLIECIIDAWGRMRLCCQDWRGEIVLGDVWTQSLWDLLRARDRIIRAVCCGAMTDSAPSRCRRCDSRIGPVDFDAQIANDARAWCAQVSKGEG